VRSTPQVPCPDDPPFPNTDDTIPPEPIIPGVGTTVCDNDILVPGDYGDLIIKNRCIFNGEGDYNIRSIWAKGKSRIEFAPIEPFCDPGRRFNVNVLRYVLMAPDVLVNTITDDSDPNKGEEMTYAVFITVQGEDIAYNDDPLAGNNGHSNRCENLQGNPAAFCHKGDGRMHACRTYVPNGTFVVNGNMSMEMLIYSEYFISREKSGGLPVHTSIPCDDAAGGIPTYRTCCEAPPLEAPDCACNFDILEVTLDGVVTIAGHNILHNVNGKTTVDYVIIVPPTTSIPVDDPLSTPDICAVPVDELIGDVPFSSSPPIAPNEFCNIDQLKFQLPPNCQTGTFHVGLVNVIENPPAPPDEWNHIYCIDANSRLVNGQLP
jgi:hypothetical protein